MKFFLRLAFSLCVGLPFSSYSQEYSYTNYDIGQGLAGSTVYCITQDKDGFIWVGTETGVSRFDGTHFTNFTTSDGLPDIEILRIFGDSKGRVWMAPFRKSVCYYYKGRIYNQDNDSLLRQIHLKDKIESITEDSKGSILLQEQTALHLLSPDGSISRFDSIDGKPIRGSVAVSRDSSDGFWIQDEEKIYRLSGKKFSFVYPIGNFPEFNSLCIVLSPHWVVWREQFFRTTIRSLATGQMIHRPFGKSKLTHVSFSLIGDSLIYFNEFSGSTEYNIHTGRTKLFLPGREVSRTFRDESGNLWFTTIGHGIFRLNSDAFTTIKVQTGEDPQTSITAINRIGRDIWIGNNHNSVYALSLKDYVLRAAATSQGVDAKNRVLYIDTINKGQVFFASDNGVIEVNQRQDLGHGPSAKAAFRESSSRLLFSTYWGVIRFDPKHLQVTDTLWRERSTAVYAHEDSIYIGTLEGLYRINPDKSIFFLGKNIPFLRKRISCVAEAADHIVWTASDADAGILGIRNDSVVAMITKTQGLTSNVCRTLLIHHNILWVGTDMGLNKIELDKPGYPITRYTSDDGLGSNIINTIYADSSMVFVGTPAGLSFFDQSKVKADEECRLYFLRIINAGNDQIRDTSHLVLSYKENDIRFEFAGISYRSAGNITYRYRLTGLDSSWQKTKDTYLGYPTLPSGQYTFQLQAINKFGIESRILTLPFVVNAPFWRTLWFDIALLIIFLLLIWLFISMRVKYIQRRQEEATQFSQRMAELENKALQAQMNPHFIFNCLNSIQQYIFDQDIFAANKYITGFARLIRATLNYSTQAFIPLADEINFLSEYLSLEKLRFKDKMDYTIRADPHIDTRGVSIPPMLLQPFVENSMRHGLRHKTDGKGYIVITMQPTTEGLTITIEDNGIGRRRAAGYKTSEHIEYQSKGMSMTADRIRMMNSMYNGKIQSEIIDLEDERQRPAGTRVVLRFPLYPTIQRNEL